MVNLTVFVPALAIVILAKVKALEKVQTPEPGVMIMFWYELVPMPSEMGEAEVLVRLMLPPVSMIVPEAEKYSPDEPLDVIVITDVLLFRVALVPIDANEPMVML